jgi:hypothetical protein
VGHRTRHATAQILRKPTASGPFLPSITSTATRRHSARPMIPARPSAEACLKRVITFLIAASSSEFIVLHVLSPSLHDDQEGIATDVWSVFANGICAPLKPAAIQSGGPSNHTLTRVRLHEVLTACGRSA